MKNKDRRIGLGTRFDQPGDEVDLSKGSLKPTPSYYTGSKRWCCKCQMDKPNKGGTRLLSLWVCSDCKRSSQST